MAKWFKEWQSLIIGIVFGIPTLAVCAFEVYVQVAEIRRGGGPDYMPHVGQGLLWACLAILIGLSIAFNIRSSIHYAKRSKEIGEAHQITGPPFPDSPLAMATRATFEALSTSQKILVRYIYRHPNTGTAFLLPVLDRDGFPGRVSADSLNSVLTTNLVSRDTQHVFPNPAVKEIVERLIELEQWPLPETVKSITTETIEAMRIDCNLGCEQRVAQELAKIRQGFDGQLSELSEQKTMAEVNAERRRRIEEAAPRFLVLCPDKQERIIKIINTSDQPIHEVTLGPLVHIDRWSIDPHGSPIGSILPKETKEKRLIVTKAGSIWQAMRTITDTSIDTIAVSFTDDTERVFEQEFVLTSNQDGTVTWKRGEIRLLSEGSVSSVEAH